jgi:hypothetical protein
MIIKLSRSRSGAWLLALTPAVGGVASCPGSLDDRSTGGVRIDAARASVGGAAGAARPPG